MVVGRWVIRSYYSFLHTLASIFNYLILSNLTSDCLFWSESQQSETGKLNDLCSSWVLWLRSVLTSLLSYSDRDLVMLWPGVLLDVRQFWVVLVLGSLLLPLAMLCSWLYQTSLFTQIHWTALFFLLLTSLHWSCILFTIWISLYDTILTVTYVRYMYDTILQDFPCMISISEPLLQLVSVLGELQSLST